MTRCEGRRDDLSRSPLWWDGFHPLSRPRLARRPLSRGGSLRLWAASRSPRTRRRSPHRSGSDGTSDDCAGPRHWQGFPDRRGWRAGRSWRGPAGSEQGFAARCWLGSRRAR
uniref:ExsB protein n=1 Tax=uncultured marine virus TaxID=186617 RepID=A0A0F7L8E7_9VIRU|nr:exsB protein [uncultured marine virus]